MYGVDLKQDPGRVQEQGMEIKAGVWKGQELGRTQLDRSLVGNREGTGAWESGRGHEPGRGQFDRGL